MCGIGWCPPVRNPLPKLLVDTLKRLEYRGYDSAGVATLGTSGIERRRAGKESSVISKSC